MKKIVLLAAAALLLSLVAIAGPAGNAKAGFEVFKKNCEKCHGEQGKGNGPAARLLKIKPADWTDRARMSKLSENDLVSVVTKGGAAVGKSTVMPAFGDKLQAQEIRDVVALVQQMGGNP